MEFKFRGPPQSVARIDDEDFTLHDPLLVTVLDFDRRVLDQLAHVLHLAVVETFNKSPEINKKKFFRHRQKEWVDPSEHEGGKDVYYLLKNIEQNANLYADLLDKDEKDVKETAVFLCDKIRNEMAHQSYLGCPKLTEQTRSTKGCALRKTETTKKCMAESAKLIKWILDAEFYKDIRDKAEKIICNIKNMQGVFKDFLNVQESMTARKENSKNTKKAITLLEDMLEGLKVEDSMEEEKDRPLTHLVNLVLAPRVKVPIQARRRRMRRRRRRR